MTEDSRGTGQHAARPEEPVPAARDVHPGPPAPEHGTVRVEGLSETLRRVRHELDLISHASKFDWVNKRLIVLRNAVIAFAVIAGVAIVIALCYREAFRQTLNISAFDVPERLAERGITGQVVAKALFDELIKRRKTVTVLDAGDVKEGWTADNSDVPIPETHFTLQSVFRYLRELTGNQIVVDGEMLVNGDDITIKARVAGNPPIAASGKLEKWETLLGSVADYVYDITQPAVLVSYLGVSAKTPGDLVRLSRYVVTMADANPRLPRNVMAVAYDAYGGALMRQDKLASALAAFNQAIAYDPALGLPVMDAAEANYRLGNYHVAMKLYDRAGRMKIGDAAKKAALRRRVSAVMNGGDCAEGEAAIREARAFSRYDEQWERWMEARYLAECAYEESKAYEIVHSVATLHPDSANAWIYYSLILLERPGGKYWREAAAGAQRAIDSTTDPKGVLNYFAHINLASLLARLGQTDRAMAVFEDARQIVKADRVDLATTLADIRYYARDFAAAEKILRPLIATDEGHRPDAFGLLGRALAAQGKAGEALTIFRTGQKLFPAACELYNEAGKVLVGQLRLAEAVSEFERGISAVKKCGLNYISEARALIDAREPAVARDRLDALIRAAPLSDGAQEARELLAHLRKTK